MELPGVAPPFDENSIDPGNCVAEDILQFVPVECIILHM